MDSKIVECCECGRRYNLVVNVKCPTCSAVRERGVASQCSTPDDGHQAGSQPS